MTEGIISIITNANYHSKRIAQKLYNSLSIRGFKPFYGFRNDASLCVCVGGDGSFLKAVHRNNFPKIAFVGINTAPKSGSLFISFSPSTRSLDIS